MIVMRLIHLKDIPSYQSVLDSISKNNTMDDNESENIVESKKIIKEQENIEKNNISKDQIKNTTQTKLKIETSEQVIKKELSGEMINSFEELIILSSVKKDIELKYDLERNVNLIKFSPGKIDIAFNENLNKNFVRNLSERLLEWTNKRWVISLTKETGQKSFLEQNKMKKDKLLEQGKNEEIYKLLKNTFPDAELIDIKKK